MPAFGAFTELNPRDPEVGYAVDRPWMKKLFGYAEPGDTVVVWRVDRLGRSLIDVMNTVNLLQGRGVQLRSISDGIDPASTTGRLMLNMLATLADYERELITERVNSGIAAAKAGGTKFGRPLMDSKGITYVTVDITEVPEALEYITVELGYSQAPVVVNNADDGDRWSGLRRDKLVQAAMTRKAA